MTASNQTLQKTGKKIIYTYKQTEWQMDRVQANCGFSLSSLENDRINETKEITKYLQVSKVN